MDRFLSWGKKVGLKAAGTFGLIIIGGSTAAIATGDLADVIEWQTVWPTVKVAIGATATQVILPALTALAQRAKAVKPGAPPENLFGVITDD